ncbi:MAG: ferrous iron transport protein A [Theionarchaea archaeon]|nr:ferrous iron transport protein A [Theionarchaea archaeon]
MDKEIPLLHMNAPSGIVTRIEGGHGMRTHLACLGIRVNKRVSKVSSQPFRGPVVVEVDGKQIAMGRGMCRKIFVVVE